eukprot:gene33784-12680_t
MAVLLPPTREVQTFATVTEVFHRRPPYELMVTSGYGEDGGRR